MNVSIINPKNNSPLRDSDKGLVDSFGNVFPIIKGVARISELENYTGNFGMQWNKFDKTQFDPNISTRLYLMGEVNTENSAVSYSYPRIPNWFVGQERLILTNMGSNDIVNIF